MKRKAATAHKAGEEGTTAMKSAIVGCGSIAKVHAGCISRLEPAELSAVADCVPEQADKMASEYGVKPYYDLETMLDQEEIDVLHICTPHYLHVPMASAALKRGIHVFMEKPPVIDNGQWEQLKQSVEEAAGGARLGICFQNRFNNSVCYVKEQLEKGTYGRILCARGLVNWHRDEAYYRNSSWRGRWETEGGGALINQSVHTLDLLQYFIGEKPLSMDAVMDNQHLKGIIEVEDTMAATIVYPDAAASFYVTTGYGADLPPLVELECEKARVRIEEETVTVRMKDGGRLEQDFNDGGRLGKSYWGAGHMKCIRTFYECMESGTPFPMELNAMEHTVWLMLKAYETAKSKYNGEGRD